MHVYSIPTARFNIGDSLSAFLDIHLPQQMLDGSIVAITSKIVSIAEGQVIKKSSIRDKLDLVVAEADLILKEESPRYGIHLTIKNNILIPAAGIDESNAWGEYYILYPEDVMKSASQIWKIIKSLRTLQSLGIIITDSHVTPMRRGTVGIGLGWCGFQPVYNYIGTPDLDGLPMKVTQSNLLDSLASSAVLCMGEGSEQSPIAIIEQPPKVTFVNTPPTETEVAHMAITMEDDLYGPLLKAAPWEQC